jgi:hypothetical protein
MLKLLIDWSAFLADSKSVGWRRPLQWCHDVARGWLQLQRHCAQVPPYMEHERIMGDKSGFGHRLVCICLLTDFSEY